MAEANTDQPPPAFDPCSGSWHDGELREGCDDCQRRTSTHQAGARPWVSPPLILVFECELRIPPEDAHG